MADTGAKTNVAGAGAEAAAGAGAEAGAGAGVGAGAGAGAGAGESLKVVGHKDKSRSYVSATARATAAMRSTEHKRDDALFRDPYALALAGDEGFVFLESLSGSQRDGFNLLLAVRTRFIDDEVAAAVAAGVRQVAVVGAGLDTRPYRLSGLEGVSIFELDFQQVFDVKGAILARAGAVVTAGKLIQVGVDLSLPTWTEKLATTAFAADEPTLWILEGFTGYLHLDELRDVFGKLAALSATDSRIVATFVGGEGLHTGTSHKSAGAVNNSPKTKTSGFHKTVTDDGDKLLAEFGWTTEKASISDLATKYGRDAMPLSKQHYWLVTGTRGDVTAE